MHSSPASLNVWFFLLQPRSAWSHWFWSFCFADQAPLFPSPAWKFSLPCMAAWFGSHSDEAEIWASESARLSIPRGSWHSSQKKRRWNRELNYQRTTLWKIFNLLPGMTLTLFRQSVFVFWDREEVGFWHTRLITPIPLKLWQWTLDDLQRHKNWLKIYSQNR